MAEKRYHVLMHRDAAQKAVELLDVLYKGGIPGARLSRVLESMGDRSLSSMKLEDFVEALFLTKKPCIFAESELCGDGSDWTQAELSLLGDIAVAVPTVAYDNGLHSLPTVHPEPVSIIHFMYHSYRLSVREGSLGVSSDDGVQSEYLEEM